MIDVTLSDGSKYTVFRRFNEFHDMNQKLEERFPVDAGYFNYGQRTLPELPGKILFGRSAVRNVAEQRLPQLDEYLKVRRHMLVCTLLCHFVPCGIESRQYHISIYANAVCVYRRTPPLAPGVHICTETIVLNVYSGTSCELYSTMIA